ELKLSGNRIREGFEFRCDSVGQRIAIRIQEHRHRLVITHETHDFDHAALSYLLLCRAESRVAHLRCAQQFGAEVIDSLLVAPQSGGPFSFSDVADDGFTQTRLSGSPTLSGPRKLRRPISDGEQRRKSRQ